ncbi:MULTISPECIES: TIR domain-containing protein [Sphingomonas]|uniref:TIR domain-containing protein n=1 Tax=Sphingomonas TaxID=13687 RepID=UPI0013B3FCDF|nr:MULTISPECIES: TIR domain-containing protein [Sphingomonas]
MAHVFLSYAHDDLALARPLVAALEKAGHQVWYDRHIEGGAQYSHRIEQALDAAAAVVVLWTEHSVASAWVRDEAADGRDRGKLVPVSAGGVQPPIGFRQYQTIELGKWSGRGKVPRLADLLQAVADRTEASASSPSASIADSAPVARPRPSPSRRSWLIAAAAAVLMLAGGVALWRWPGRDSLPVVTVAPSDGSPRARAIANDLFVSLGSLAQIGEGRWKLVDPGTGTRADLTFRPTDSGSATAPQAGLVLTGRDNGLLWSGEFESDGGSAADVRQRRALAAGRVLDCNLEARAAGGLPGDLLKMFLNACAASVGNGADSPDAQLRPIVARLPRFEPAWRRLILADADAVTEARFTPDLLQAQAQLRTDVAQVKPRFPDLPELAIAENELAPRLDYGGQIARLSAAVERAPTSARLWSELSNALAQVGLMNDAVAKARKAAELDPLSPDGTTNIVMTLANSGELDAARQELASAEKLWAGTAALRNAQLAFAMRYGDVRLAQRLDPSGYNTAAFYQARLDPSPANIARLKAGIDEFRSKAVTASQVGWATQALGQFGLVDDVFYWFGRLSTDDAARIAYVLFRPTMASVRQNPRFLPLAKRLGLLAYWRASRRWPDFCDRPGISYNCQAEAAKLG